MQQKGLISDHRPKSYWSIFKTSLYFAPYPAVKVIISYTLEPALYVSIKVFMTCRPNLLWVFLPLSAGIKELILTVVMLATGSSLTLTWLHRFISTRSIFNYNFGVGNYKSTFTEWAGTPCVLYLIKPPSLPLMTYNKGFEASTSISGPRPSLEFCDTYIERLVSIYFTYNYLSSGRSTFQRYSR